jgi:hypothetical protein
VIESEKLPLQQQRLQEAVDAAEAGRTAAEGKLRQALAEAAEASSKKLSSNKDMMNCESDTVQLPMCSLQTDTMIRNSRLVMCTLFYHEHIISTS